MIARFNDGTFIPNGQSINTLNGFIVEVDCFVMMFLALFLHI